MNATTSEQPRVGLGWWFLIPGIMLLLALAPWPYLYFQVLRYVVFGFACWGLIDRYRGEYKGWIVLSSLAIIAILFNPLEPIHMSRQIWHIIDIATIFVFAFTGLWMNMEALSRDINPKSNSAQSTTNSPCQDTGHVTKHTLVTSNIDKQVILDSNWGKPTVLVYWGLNYPSAKVLSALDRIEKHYCERVNIVTIALDVPHDLVDYTYAECAPTLTSEKHLLDRMLRPDDVNATPLLFFYDSHGQAADTIRGAPLELEANIETIFDSLF